MDALSPLSSATALPPAVPTGNASDPCAFADRVALLDRIASDLDGYNMTLLVTTCSGVCQIVYGEGNPDISGIGAMISYGVQALVTIIFGPPLAFVLLACGMDLDSLTRRRFTIWRLLANLSRSVHQSNVFLALSVAIASVIRLK